MHYTAMTINDTFIIPDWPAPAWVKSAMTTRLGGYSQGEYAGFNLASHVGDDAQHVIANRALLMQQLTLPKQPIWLEQVHGCDVYPIIGASPQVPPLADASYTALEQQVCAVLTADCLPVLFCSSSSKEVAAAHAGWKGLRDGVLEQTVRQFKAPAEHLYAWLGAAIGPTKFEVGAEVYQQFIAQDPDTALAFVKQQAGKYHANLYQLARIRLHKIGVTRVFGGDFCTLSDPTRFFSYRAQPRCGRMASLIWIDE